MTMTYANRSIALDKLHPSDRNARRMRGAPAKLEALARAIEANGLAKPLIVAKSPKGWQVEDGARRLAAIRSLAARGAWSGDVPCRVIDADAADAEVVGLSLDLNETSLPAHPLDRLAAFRRMASLGMTPDAIAARYALDAETVRRIIALDRLPMPIRVAYAQGAISDAVAFAFSECDDERAALALFRSRASVGTWRAEDVRREVKRIAKTGQRDRDAMTEEHRLFRFVGLDDYTAQGGAFFGDLFTPEGARRVNRALVESIARAKLDAAARAECDAAPAWVFASLIEDDRREDDKRPECFEGCDMPRDAEHLPRGCVAWINWRGEAIVEANLILRADFEAWEASQIVEPDDAEAPGAEARPEDAEGEDDDAEGGDAPSVPPVAPTPERDPEAEVAPMSQPRIQDAGGVAADMLAHALAFDPDAAFDLAVLAAADGVRVFGNLARFDGLGRWLANDAETGEGPASIVSQWAERFGAWHDAHAGATPLGWIVSLSMEQKRALLAACVAARVHVTQSEGYYNKLRAEPTRGASYIAWRVGLNPRAAWSDDDRIAFFEKATKAEMASGPLAHLPHADVMAMSKPEAVAAAAEAARSNGWLPPYFAALDFAAVADADSDADSDAEEADAPTPCAIAAE